jgi:RES domain
MTDDDRPLPTSELGSKRLLIRSLPQGTPLYRIHNSSNDPTRAIFFGQHLSHRFDAPKRYGVLYAGIDAHVAFRETFFHGELDRLVLDRDKQQRLKNSSISILSVDRELRLVRGCLKS